MSEFLMPITLLVKKYFSFGNSFLDMLPLYFFLFFIIIQVLIIERGKIYVNYFINQKVVICFLIAIACQFIAAVISYSVIGDSVFLNPNPLDHTIGIVIFLAFILINYFIISILVKREKDIYNFLKGIYITVLCSLFITYCQLFYLLFPSSIFQNIVTFFGTYFEERNSATLDWYILGSYVQTVGRINGFFGETSLLTTHLSIICLPFILSAIKNKFNIFNINKKYNPIKYYILLLLIIAMLLQAKSTTGIIAIFVSIVLFYIIIPFKRKITFGFILALLTAFLIYGYSNIPYIYNIFQQFLFDKSSGNSFNNRSGGAFGLFYTFINNPLFGVGKNYTDYYLFENIPNWARNNAEFMDFATVRHSFPISSNLLGWLAQYGIIVFTMFLVYIYRLQSGIYKLIKKIDKKNKEYIINKTIADGGLFFFLMFFTLSTNGFAWEKSSYFIMFFFFVVFRQYLKRTV